MGKGAKEGILIKDAATLQKLHKVNTVVVDKTGTITQGKPTLVDIVTISDIAQDDMVSIIASLEKKSEHPIAHAIVNYASEKNMSLSDVSLFESIQGKGLQGNINGIVYFVGNARLVKEMNISFDSVQLDQYTLQGKTPVILATKEKVIGYVLVADAVKPASREAIAALHREGIRVIMLTGDDEKAAKHIASLV